jgi:hypothetical protein
LETGEGDYNLCEGLKLADAVIHSIAVARMLNQTVDERYENLEALVCSLDLQVLISLLELASNNLSEHEQNGILGITLHLDFGFDCFDDILKDGS